VVTLKNITSILYGTAIRMGVGAQNLFIRMMIKKSEFLYQLLEVDLKRDAVETNPLALNTRPTYK